MPTFPLGGFLWLVRPLQIAWDVELRTHIFNIERAAFNWPIDLKVDDIQELDLYLDVSRE